MNKNTITYIKLENVQFQNAKMCNSRKIKIVSKEHPLHDSNFHLGFSEFKVSEKGCNCTGIRSLLINKYIHKFQEQKSRLFISRKILLASQLQLYPFMVFLVEKNVLHFKVIFFSSLFFFSSTKFTGWCYRKIKIKLTLSTTRVQTKEGRCLKDNRPRKFSVRSISILKSSVFFSLSLSPSSEIYCTYSKK